MKKFHLFFLLILPSPLSMVVTFICAILFVLYISWSYLSNSPLIYQRIYGSDGFSARVWESTGSVSEWMSQFFSSPIGYYVSLSVLAIVVGIAVYALLQIVSLLVTGTVHFFQRAELASGPIGLMEIFIQLWIRSLALVGLVIFLAALAGAIIPTIETLVDVGANLLAGFQVIGIVQYAVALVLTIISLHTFVILLRLLMLRTRIFSSTLTD